VSSDRSSLPEYIEIGSVVRPHGVRGELVVEANSELLPGLASETPIYFGTDRVKLIVERLRPHRGRLLLKAQGIDDRNQAEELRQQALYLHSSEVEPLPDGSYYYWQIMGMEVYSESGEKLGIVKHIIETGANDVYVLQTDDDHEVLIPAIDDVIQEVDLDRERMVVHVLPGLIQTPKE